MASKFTEHLIILHDHGEGLLNRVYAMKRFEIPKWNDPEYDPFTRRLGQSFPVFPEKLSREKGMDFFTRRSPEVKAAYEDYYMTFIDVIDFNKKAIKVITDVAKSCAVVSLDISPEIYSLYLGLLSTIAKLNILLCGFVETARPILASYVRAHATLVGVEEPHAATIAQYLEEFGARPVERLRTVFEGDVAKYVGGALLPLHDVLTQYQTTRTFVMQRLFNVLHKSEDVLSNRNEATHNTLLLLWSLRQWVLWGYLVCPSELAAEGSVPVLLQALSEFTTLVLHRDELYDVYAAYKELFNSFEVKLIKFKLSKHKDSFHRVANAFQEQLDRRVAMRRFLVSELTAMSSLFLVSPAALGPRAPMVLAALRLAKEEILWYFSHRGAHPYRAPNKFTFPMDPHARALFRLLFTVSDLLLAQAQDAPDLLGAQTAAALRALLPRHAAAAVTSSPHVVNSVAPAGVAAPAGPAAGVVEWYYRGHLGLDATAIRDSLEALNKANPLSPAVYNSVEDAAQVLEAVAAGAPALPAAEPSPEDTLSGGLDGFRLNVHRAVAGLLNRTAGVSLTSPLLLDLTRKLSAAVSRSRFVDQLGALTMRHASLQQLRWWIPQVEEDLRESLALTAGGRDAVSAVFMVRALGSATRCVHRVCPEEVPTVGGVAMKTTDDWLRLICETATRQWLFTHYKISIALGIALEPDEVIARMTSKDKTGARSLPGFESALVPRNPDPLRRLRNEQKALQDVAVALSQSPVLTVFTSVFSPREYFITSLHASLRDIVHKIVRPAAMPPTYVATSTVRGAEFVKGPRTVQRPSVILNCVSRLLLELQRLDRFGNFNGVSIARHVLLSEFTGLHPKTGGEPTGEASFGDKITLAAPEQEDPAIATICQWYIQVLSSDLDAGRIMHAPLYRCFVTLPATDRNAPALRALEEYTDYSEMVALARLLGPMGVDMLQKKLTAQLSTQVQAVFTILAANSTALGAIRGRFTEPLAWASTEAALKDKEQLLTMLISCGALLEFRDMVQSGMAEAARQSIPDVSASLAAATSAAAAVAGVTGHDPRAANLRSVHELVGGERSLFDDVALKDIVRRTKTTVQNAQVWSLLPEMFCLAMHNPAGALVSGVFTIANSGHTGNAHLMARALRDLVLASVLLPPEVAPVGLTRGHPLGKAPAGVLPLDRAKYELERVLDLAAYCTLNVNAAVTKTVHPSVLNFIETYVKACGDALPMSKLERSLPYTLLRTNYIQLHEQQIGQNRTARAADEDARAY